MINLYDLYDNQKIYLNFIADLSNASRKLVSKLNKKQYIPGVNFIDASLAVIDRFGKDYKKIGFEITDIKIKNFDILIKENVVDSKPFCKLIEFKRLTDDIELLKIIQSQPKVLIVAPLSGHFATLLKDTVETMLVDHNVYITDWEDAKNVPISEGEFSLETYVSYVQDFIRKFDNIHLMAVCQPTVPSLIAVSLMAANKEKLPESLTLMAGPIDVRKNPTYVNKLATTNDINWFKNNLIYGVPNRFKGAGRKVYPGFLQLTAFVSMNYNKHVKSHIDYFYDVWKSNVENINKHEKFYDEYNAVLDMDARYYLETVEEIFQKVSLPQKKLKIKDHIVDPSLIKGCRLLTIEGENDDITGIGQTEAAHTLCSNILDKKHYVIDDVGHYGVFSGKKWKNIIYPIVKSFIEGN